MLRNCRLPYGVHLSRRRGVPLARRSLNWRPSCVGFRLFVAAATATSVQPDRRCIVNDRLGPGQLGCRRRNGRGFRGPNDDGQLQRLASETKQKPCERVDIHCVRKPRVQYAWHSSRCRTVNPPSIRCQCLFPPRTPSPRVQENGESTVNRLFFGSAGNRTTARTRPRARA